MVAAMKDDTASFGFQDVPKAEKAGMVREVFDRVAGRYASLDDERDKPRTVASIATSKQLDLFDLRRRYAALAFLVDVDYGSATFVDVRSPALFEVRVSTTGLLMRPR